MVMVCSKATDLENLNIYLSSVEPKARIGAMVVVCGNGLWSNRYINTNHLDTNRGGITCLES